MLYSYTKIKLQKWKTSPNQNRSKTFQLGAIIFPHKILQYGNFKPGGFLCLQWMKNVEIPHRMEIWGSHL